MSGKVLGLGPSGEITTLAISIKSFQGYSIRANILYIKILRPLLWFLRLIHNFFFLTSGLAGGLPLHNYGVGGVWRGTGFELRPGSSHKNVRV